MPVSTTSRGGPHQRRADRAEQAALVGVQPGLLGELLGVQAPSPGEHRETALALERGQAVEQLQAGQQQMMLGYRLLEGNHLEVPAGPGGGPLGVEPERPGPAAVQPRRGVVRRGAAHGHHLRHGRHLARRRKRLGKELRRPGLGPLYRHRRLADGLGLRHLPGRIP